MQVENRELIPSQDEASVSLPANTASKEIAIIEQKRIALLQKMQNIAVFENKQDPPGSQAFEALLPPFKDIQSCLKIAKTYLLTSEIAQLTSMPHTTELNRKSVVEWFSQGGLDVVHRRAKENMIRWMLMDILETSPAYLGIYGKELYDYFLHITYLINMLGGVQARIKQDAALSHLEQGQILDHLSANPGDVLPRIKAHQPIVFAFHTMGLGDVLLTLPVILDVVYAFAQASVKSPIRVIVDKTVKSLVNYLIGAENRVEVYSVERTDENIYIHTLLQLACLDEALKQERERQGLLFFLAADMIFFEKMRKSELAKDIFTGFINFQTTYPFEDAESEDTLDAATNFRRSAQRSLSVILGMKIYNNQARDDIRQISERMKSYVMESIQQSPPLQREIMDIRRRAGFENGYICVIERGKHSLKRITPSLFTFLLDALEELFCQNNMGILLIKSKDEVEDEPLSTLALQKNIPYHELTIREDVAYTFAFLQHASGVIGPDTFLMHAAEYVSHLPVLNLFNNSNSHIFRVNEEVIAVEHTIAKGGREDSSIITYYESVVYEQEFVHPFTIFSSDEEKEKVNIIIQKIQDIFLQRLKEGLDIFKEKVLRNTGMCNHIPYI